MMEIFSDDKTIKSVRINHAKPSENYENGMCFKGDIDTIYFELSNDALLLLYFQVRNRLETLKIINMKGDSIDM